VRKPTKLGIPQGSPLSPQLLNIYLDHLLHLPWERSGASPPLIRYVDDLLLPCRPDEDFDGLYRNLEQIVVPAGMQLKHGFAWTVHDLRTTSVDWLGYRLQLTGDLLEVRPTLFVADSDEQARLKRERLVDRFSRLHDRPNGWRFVRNVICSYLMQAAPTFPFVDRESIYEQISSAVSVAAFAEVMPSYEEVAAFWEAAYQAWECDSASAAELWTCAATR
jgi:Reverse transcriptase (RNA-dependent DNA polymerase)